MTVLPLFLLIHPVQAKTTFRRPKENMYMLMLSIISKCVANLTDLKKQSVHLPQKK